MVAPTFFSGRRGSGSSVVKEYEKYGGYIYYSFVHLRISFSMRSDEAVRSLKENVSKYKLIQPKFCGKNISSC